MRIDIVDEKVKKVDYQDSQSAENVFVAKITTGTGNTVYIGDAQLEKIWSNMPYRGSK